ncbi:3-deoxy-manno-octulosonate cytidylyltransferase (CMP-KDO synthetase) [Pseudoalteromonas nigrifaciens]|uniref:3-deoxy-manno-octulosonate cytidylyltransferase (CMP-KDO synthetase) n=1 Tax=Pseudoalteromonas nigrifaciens TaxID=28109 RepID=A0AAC9UDS0_9GAMM|nr:3-deoxy-manno-octulosonate cytidylyltransferase (CMP-KDO synthetase) [Pseudoalteromonas nigrifaciens]
MLEDVIVATDNKKIESLAVELKVPVVMTSLEHISGTDRINEVAQLNDWPNNTVILNVQGDEPLIPSQLIKKLIAFTDDNIQFDITTAISALTSKADLLNANVVKAIVGADNCALYFTRASAPFNRDNPSDFSLAFRHIGIYAYRKYALQKFCQYEEAPLEKYEKLEQLRALSHGMRIGAMEFNEVTPHGVDTLQDYQKLKQLMET